MFIAPALPKGGIKTSSSLCNFSGVAKRIALHLETDLWCKVVMGYHSHHSFPAALNNTLVFSYNSQSAAAVLEKGGSSLSLTG